MEHLLSFLSSHIDYAHWVIFALFMLAGINLPISEDLLIIFSAMIASTVPESVTWKLFLAVFLGAYFSDFIPYWIGRRFGVNLWKIKLFARMIKKERIEQVRGYYAKYGMLTLLIGRFIPFGVRNCLFAAAGMGKMKFWKFLISDGIACLISNTTLFTLAYIFGKNYQFLLSSVQLVNVIIFLTFAFALIIFIWYKRKKTLENTE